MADKANGVQRLRELLVEIEATTDGDYLTRLSNGQRIALGCVDFIREHGPELAALQRRSGMRRGIGGCATTRTRHPTRRRLFTTSEFAGSTLAVPAESSTANNSTPPSTRSARRGIMDKHVETLQRMLAGLESEERTERIAGEVEIADLISRDCDALDFAIGVLQGIEAAEQRVREVEAELARWNRTHIRLIDSDEPLERAQARADANEKDAARYRYWRSTRIVSDDGFGGFSERDIDSAIDEARLGAEDK